MCELHQIMQYEALEISGSLKIYIKLVVQCAQCIKVLTLLTSTMVATVITDK